MSSRTCIDCGARFPCPPEQIEWRTRCYGCFKRFTAEQPKQRNLPAISASLSIGMRDLLPQIIQLTHPDRHGGSESANKVTAWLLQQRRKLG